MTTTLTKKQHRTVEFDNSHYERSHGKQARGHGCWGFGVDTPTVDFGDRWDDITNIIWITASLTDAKKKAREIVNGPLFDNYWNDGHVVLYVLP